MDLNLKSTKSQYQVHFQGELKRGLITQVSMFAHRGLAEPRTRQEQRKVADTKQSAVLS